MQAKYIIQHSFDVENDHHMIHCLLSQGGVKCKQKIIFTIDVKI